MKHQILLLEDSFLNRELLCDWLEGEGYEVVVAEDLNTGLAAVRDHSPDLVLLDVQLGADDGLRFAKWMSNEPELQLVPVIAVTAQAMPADRERILESGCKACIAKPVDFVLLRTSLQRWLPSRDPVNLA
ncbi:MAG: response regulator [Acidipila sp.]|nr:response regulator [Acidipila sp.]